MADGNREAVIEKVREIAERVGASEGIEIVDVQLLGGGRNRVLRIFIDKPEGVTHADCEFISQQVGTIPGRRGSHSGSGGTRWRSARPAWSASSANRGSSSAFSARRSRWCCAQPVEDQRHWAGTLKSFAAGVITLEPAPGKSVQFPLEQVEKANLKFEW